MRCSLILCRANVGALSVDLGALFIFPVNLSLSLCFSGHVICSLAALLFLLLTPLRTLTSCRPHIDLWPISLSFFFFFAASCAFTLFSYFWKPHFFKCPLCDQFPSHRLCTQHPLGGGRWPSLSLTVSVCVHHPFIFFFLSCSLAALIFSISHSVLSFFFPSLLSLPCLSACAWGWLSSPISPCVCTETLGLGAGVMLVCQRVRLRNCMHCCLTNRCVFARHAYWPYSLSLFLLSDLSYGGVKKATNLFCELWHVSVHVWMLWLFCMSLILCKLCSFDGLLCVNNILNVYVCVVWG